jgi:hypothetical protein
MRYLVPTVPLWYLFPAYGLGLITRSFPKLKFLTLGLAICTVGIIVGWSGFAWYQQLHIPTKQQWRELANLVESEASASDTIYVVPKHHFRHLDYYLNGTDVNIGSSVSDYSCPDQQNAAWLIGKVDLLGEAVQRLATSCGVVGSETFAGQLAVYKFSAQGVMVRCNGFAPTLIGTQDSDVINGTSADDLIHGLQGNDIINGLEGDDFICGGTGNDMLNGGVGDDQIFGEEGDDILNGGPGSNMLDGGPGRNALNDGLGNDPID